MNDAYAESYINNALRGGKQMSDRIISADGKYEGVLQGDGNFVVYRVTDGKAISALGADLEPLQPKAEPVPVPLPEVRNRAAKGFSRLESKMFADDYGVYPAIGATYMYAPRSAEVDEARLIRNLDWLSQNGCHYIRILLMVGNAPYWPFKIEPRSWDAYHRVMELAWERRMRTQPVIFADAQVMMPSKSDRETFVGEVAAFCNQRREMIQFIEVANESELNGVSMEELTRYCKILSTTTDIPFAASSPTGSHEEIVGLEKLYGEHGCRSPIATPHFDRKAWEDG